MHMSNTTKLRAPRKTLPARITYEWLRRKGACEDALAWFAETYPNGIARITASAVASAGTMERYYQSSNLHWLVNRAAATKRCPACDHAFREAHRDPKILAKWLRERQRSPRKS